MYHVETEAFWDDGKRRYRLSLNPAFYEHGIIGIGNTLCQGARTCGLAAKDARMISSRPTRQVTGEVTPAPLRMSSDR